MIGHDQLTDDAVAVHETEGVDGSVVQVAEPDADQPEALPACTYNVELKPVDKPVRDFDREACSTHPESSPAVWLVWYLVAPVTAGHDHVIELEAAVHDTDGAAGTVAHAAEPEPDQPPVLPACTYSVALAPAERPLEDFDRPVCSVHVESSELVRYLVAPTGAFQIQLIDDTPAVHDTDGEAGTGREVVQVAASVPDQPAVLPATTCRVSWEPPDRPLRVFDAPTCSTHSVCPRPVPRSYLVWYLVAPVTAGQDHVIELEVAVHDTDGAAGTVVHAAESEADQPEALPACTYSVAVAPAEKPLEDFDRPVCSVHVELSGLVWYLVARTGAFQVQVIDDTPAAHDTDGAGGADREVVQVAELVPDQPSELPACTSRVSSEPSERPLRDLDTSVCSTHEVCPSPVPRLYRV